MPGEFVGPASGGGGAVRPPFVVPPLPAGIPILPGYDTVPRLKRLLRRIVLALIAVGAAWVWFLHYYGAYDGKRIDAIVTPAMFAHVKYGTRFKVTLWDGPRILSISSSFLEPGVSPPTTCVSVYVYDPKTGAMDPRYRNSYFDCIEGLVYVIHYPSAR
jgi:hypothetical protein